MEKTSEILQIGGQESSKSLLFNSFFNPLIHDDDDLVKSIVLTGGPKGGKTTSIPAIVKALRAEGFTTFVVKETATELLNKQYHPGAADGAVSLYDFQEGITLAQILKEMKERFEARKTLQVTDRVVILFDRAVPDGGAYIDDETFKRILGTVGDFSLEDIHKMYDLIIHFVSTAKDKPQAFLASQKNQKKQKRIEDGLKDTIELEDRTMEMYPEAPNKVVLWNNCTFDEKRDTAIDAILSFVKKDTRTIRIKAQDLKMLKDVKRKKTTEANNQRRTIINYHGHTYIMGEYLDGSKVRTLEMMKGAPVPEWVLDHEELVIEPPKTKAYLAV